MLGSGRVRLRLVHWNILHGASPARAPGIALRLLELRPDVVVLTEFRPRVGGQILGVLADHGLRHQTRSAADPKRNAVALASRCPLVPSPPADAPTQDAPRWLDATLGTDLGPVHLTGVHIPDVWGTDAAALARKSRFWHHLLGVCAHRRERAHVVLGDFNTARAGQDAPPGAELTSEALMGRLLALGYADAYRLLHPNGRDRTWAPPGTSEADWHLAGFRLDHCFVSGVLAPLVREARYAARADGVTGQNLSDHALMVVELAARGRDEHENP
jgi:exonuclease III